MLEFSIITISTFVTMLNEGLKYFVDIVFKKDISRYIPIFSVIFGIILGIAGYHIPTVDMGNNIVEAIFIGISAGSAATGVNQIGKQLNKKEPQDLTTLTEQDISEFIKASTNVCDVEEEKEKEQ